MQQVINAIATVALMLFFGGLAIGGTWREPRLICADSRDRCPHGDAWDDCPDCRH